MVVEKARELGLELCQSQPYIRMQMTQSAVEADPLLCDILEEYRNKQTELMETLQNEDGADRLLIAALSRDVDALQSQLMASPLFSAAMEAQNEFAQLMSDVNREIGKCIGMEAEEESGCGHSCSGCSGCGH